jgi:hypothetical protein
MLVRSRTEELGIAARVDTRSFSGVCVMKEWDNLSSVELSEAVQRLYLRLEQYELHVAGLEEGSRERMSARRQADCLWKQISEAAAALDRRFVEFSGQDVHAHGCTVPPAAARAGTSGDAKDRVA